MPEPTQNPAPAPIGPGGLVGAGVEIADRASRWSPQQVNTIILFALAAVVGFLIYVDRRDRVEADGRMLRHYETQAELNRQVVSANTTAVQALSVQVGKLESTVNNLHRTVTAMKKDLPPEEMVIAPMPKLKALPKPDSP